MAEWGNPARREPRHSRKRERTRGTETSQYPEGREINRDARSSGERNGPQPKPQGVLCGVVGPTDGRGDASGSPLERGARDGDSPVRDGQGPRLVEILSNARLEESGVKLGGPPSKAKDSRVTDSGRVP